MIRLIGILCGSALAVSFLIVALGVPEILPDAVEDVQPDVTVALDVVAAAVPVRNPVAAPAAEPVAEPVAEPAAEPVAAATIPEPPIAGDSWYPFWTPFRSELAANGFVAQLQRTTGLDYQVVKQAPGVYVVAFAYSDDGDIQGKLTAISTATGLDFPGG